jgi:hypothetical protein
MERWRVQLPADVEPPFEVYVNGVLQREGADYERRDDVLYFDRPLKQEGRLGFWRWFLGAWGVGTYRENHTVDVRYTRGGKQLVAHDLKAMPPEQPPGG